MIYLLNLLELKPSVDITKFIELINDKSVPRRYPENIFEMERKFSLPETKKYLEMTQKNDNMVKVKYTLAEVKNAAKELAGRLRQARIKASGMFLYGSYAHGTFRDYSDIDIAIISPDFKGKDRMAIQEAIAIAIAGRSGILSAIEPIGYSLEEFTAADRTTFLGEIKRTGKRLM